MQPESHSVCSETGVRAGCRGKAIKYSPKFEPWADKAALPLIENECLTLTPPPNTHTHKKQGEINQGVVQQWINFLLTNTLDVGRNRKAWDGGGALIFMTQEDRLYPTVAQQPRLISECALSSNCACKTLTPFIFNVQ